MIYPRTVLSSLLCWATIIRGGEALSAWNADMAIANSLFLREADFNQTTIEDFGNTTVRDVYDPRITSPKSSTVWVVGHSVEVTWDTSDKPKHVTNPEGKVVLGYVEDGDPSEHLDMDHPLADGFDISDGHVKIKVPNVERRNDYIVILFGDSGNRSPAFTIN